MKKSISTFLKHPTKDSTNRSANPPVTRASTILFNSMQEMYQHELKIRQHKKVTHYTYGRYGSTTTIELENILKELEQAYHVFLTGTGFGGIALALMSTSPLYVLSALPAEIPFEIILLFVFLPKCIILVPVSAF